MLWNVKPGQPHSIQDLADALRYLSRKKRYGSNVPEALYAIDQLAQFPTIGIAKRESEQLHLGRIIESGDLAYFYLPTAFHGAAARNVGTLALWATMVEAANRLEKQKASRVCHTAVDEYAQIALGRSQSEAALTLSRKFSLQLYFVFQSREQMRTVEGDIWPVLRDNCQRFLFTIPGDAEQRELMACSEDELKQIVLPQAQAFLPTTPVQSFIRSLRSHVR